MSKDKIYQQVKEILDEALKRGQGLNSDEEKEKNMLEAITKSKELLAALDSQNGGNK
jgi:hypothetical protein